MIVHQQLAALTGKPSKKKKKVRGVDEVEVEVDDPIFTPNTASKKKKKVTKKAIKMAPVPPLLPPPPPPPAKKAAPSK